MSRGSVLNGIKYIGSFAALFGVCAALMNAAYSWGEMAQNIKTATSILIAHIEDPDYHEFLHDENISRKTEKSELAEAFIEFAEAMRQDMAGVKLSIQIDRKVSERRHYLDKYHEANERSADLTEGTQGKIAAIDSRDIFKSIVTRLDGEICVLNGGPPCLPLSIPM